MGPDPHDEIEDQFGAVSQISHNSDLASQDDSSQVHSGAQSINSNDEALQGTYDSDDIGQNLYEQMDDVCIDDKFLEDIGIISKNTFIQKSVEDILGIKRKGSIQKGKQRDKDYVLKQIRK